MADLSSLAALMESADEAGNSGLQDVAVSMIEPDPDQPRTQFPEMSLRELSASIQAQGVVQPLVVRPLDGERFVLIAGERRWRAAQMAGLESVPVVVRDLDPKGVIAVQLVENLDREDLSIIDQALGVVRLLEQTGAKAGEVAKLLGKSASWVSQRRKIGKRHDLASPFVDTGATTDPETLSMLIDLHRLDSDAYDRFLGPDSVQRTFVRDALDTAKGKGKPDKRLDKGTGGGKESPGEGDPSANPASSPPAAPRDPLDFDPDAAATPDPVAGERQDREGTDASSLEAHSASRKRRSSPGAEVSGPADNETAVSSDQLREAEANLRRLLQLDVTVTSDEGAGAVVRIHCDSAVKLSALVERLL